MLMTTGLPRAMRTDQFREASMAHRWLLAAVAAVATLSLADAKAAEIKVLSFLSSRPILTELAPAFERATGHKVTVVYGSVEPLRDRIAQGEVADVLIASRVVLDALAGRGKVAVITDVARITI